MARRRHFLLSTPATTEQYASPGGGGKRSAVPPRQRQRHGSALLRDLATATEHEVESTVLVLEFESYPDIELAFESLARERSGIELLNVRHGGKSTFATVSVPVGKEVVFERLVTDYLAEKKDSRGQPRDNQRLVDAIKTIRAATVKALWTDSAEAFPSSEDEELWWEVWLSRTVEGGHARHMFRERAHAQGLRVAAGEVQFPERSVVLAFGTLAQFKASPLLLNGVSELRRGKETAEFFDSLPIGEQRQWVDSAIERASFAEEGVGVPYVCILDTGVTRDHPLLSRSLAASDVHILEPAWSIEDKEGHGTRMAGAALLGDLVAVLEGSDAISVDHRLESVKLLRRDGGNSGDPVFHGYLTTEAVARPEVTDPARARVFAMAVTARDARDRGRPSAWSATIDRLAADAEGEGANPRLILVSAGNVDDPEAWRSYPASNETDSIHDPGQAWNALTVGAFTEKASIAEADSEGYSALAPAGGLSPFSTTSLTWQAHWPLKPDVVFEGGNAAKDALGAVWLSSLSLLTTHERPLDAVLSTLNATSAATALAAKLAAEIMSAYPGLRPETVRGLIVHSAQWTETMRQQFLTDPATPSKGDVVRLIRRCGFGAPNAERALWTVENSLTLISEGRLQPFDPARREAGGKRRGVALRDMHLYEIPWPKEALEALRDTPVEMRVTLSYFIEPNPSARGVVSRYRYESHGLRFDVRRPVESVDQFRRRVNRAARDEDEGVGGTSEGDPGWLVGKQARHRGSLHSDLWRGTAAALASRGTLAVYPSQGWWKTRERLDQSDRESNYSLIVSIHVPGVETDLITEVENRIGVAVVVGT